MNESNPKAGRFSLRRLFQFSLRSMMLLMALTAVGVWWYVQPQPAARELPGGWKLRVQMVEHNNEESGKTYEVEEGPYRVVDQHGRTRCRGRMVSGRAEGWWTFYYPSGRKMMQGRCEGGCRVGLWKSWHENGRKEAEVQYGEPAERSRIEESYGPGASHGHLPFVPVVGVITPAQFGGGYAGGGQSLHSSQLISALAANRHGAARRWWENGAPRSAGQFREDERHGTWTFWDENGKQTAAGDYLRGQRHGKWLLADEQSGRAVAVWYVGGRRTEPLDVLLPRLADDLQSENWLTRRDALRLLVDLGPGGARILTAALDDADGRRRSALLAALAKIGPDAKAALARIERIAAEGDFQTRIDANLALYAIDEERRERVFASLLAEVTSAPYESRWETIERIVYAEAYTPALLEKSLDDEDRQVRFAALSIVRIAPGFRSGWNYYGEPHPFVAELNTLLQRAAQHEDSGLAAAAKVVLNNRKFSEKLSGYGGSWSGPWGGGGFF